jgi:hypothetical protein
MESTNRESNKIFLIIYPNLDEMMIRLQTLDNSLTLAIQRTAFVSDMKEKINEVIILLFT